ncbi:hypothetical protein OH782_42490 (plasmid) [Streptomyces sp. NBC_01544]|uniref:hypothetical protein n=1 Tax=Streptomyces sp. NBC_01544 TaxID=2975871 RepID=UPI002F915B45
MADFGELETAEHLDGTFREAFPQWRDFRQMVADRARYPEFNEQRALQQVLMSDLAHRITADQDLGWLLIGSLALPARPAGNSWPADFGVPGVTDIPQQYLMPRSAFDLDLCASAVTDPNPDRAAQLYRGAVEGAVRRVAAPPDHAGTAHGIGLGGLVRYTVGDLNVFPNGQVMGIVTAQPVDPRFGPRHTPVVDDPIPIEIDIKPPAKVTVTGGPDAAQRPITALDVPGFTPFQPLLNPAVNQLADKLVLLTGKPRGLREAPAGPWHRYKDVFDAYFMLQTCQIDADHMREAVNSNWNLGPMGMDRVPAPYRFYGQDATGSGPVVPWKEGLDGLRVGSPQLHQYPDWDQIREKLGAFMDSLPTAPSGSVWTPGQGWAVQHSRSAAEAAQQDRTPRISASAARSRSTTTPDGPRRMPPTDPGTAHGGPGTTPPRQQRGRGR